MFKCERGGEEGILIARDEPSDRSAYLGLEAPEGFVFEGQIRAEQYFAKMQEYERRHNRPWHKVKRTIARIFSKIPRYTLERVR